MRVFFSRACIELPLLFSSLLSEPRCWGRCVTGGSPPDGVFNRLLYVVVSVPLGNHLKEGVMRRHSMSRGSSRRSFRSGASRVHGLNSSGASYVMRGGIRL